MATSKASASPPQIIGLMNKIMAGLGGIEKTQQNKQFGYFYRGIEEVKAALQPLLVEHGVVLCKRVKSWTENHHETGPGKVRYQCHQLVEYIFNAPDGSQITFEGLGEGISHNDDKATNKASSGAFKYAMLDGFCISTADIVDQDGEPDLSHAQTPRGKVEQARRNREEEATDQPGPKSPPPESGILKELQTMCQDSGINGKEFMQVCRDFGYIPKNKRSFNKITMSEAKHIMEDIMEDRELFETRIVDYREQQKNSK